MATLMCVRCDTGAPRCLSVLTAEKRDFPAQVREDGPCQDVRPKARSGFGVTLWGAYHNDPNFGSAAAVALPKFFHTEVFGLGPMSAVSGGVQQVPETGQ